MLHSVSKGLSFLRLAVWGLRLKGKRRVATHVPASRDNPFDLIWVCLQVVVWLFFALKQHTTNAPAKMAHPAHRLTIQALMTLEDTW